MADRDDAQLRADGDPTVEEPPVVDTHAGAAAAAVPIAVVPAVQDEDAPPRGGCRTDRRGWAGAHLHGAVRPRRRPAGRGRPPGRWC